MITSRRRTRRLLAVGGLTAVLTAGIGVMSADAGGDRYRIVSAGPLADFATATSGPYDGAYGAATIDRFGSFSVFTLKIRNVGEAAKGKRFGAHLHEGPCVTDNSAAAGPHYNVLRTPTNPTPAANRKTEVWLDFKVRGSRGSAWAVVPFVPEAGARSIVVHEMATMPDGMAGGRLACLPLVWAPSPPQAS